VRTLVCWFRRDLRVRDQTALYHAARGLPQDVEGQEEKGASDEAERSALAALIGARELPDHDDRGEDLGFMPTFGDKEWTRFSRWLKAK